MAGGGPSGSPATRDRLFRRRARSRRAPRPRTRRLIVLDASAAVELVRRSALGDRVASAIADQRIRVPAHFDAEVLSALVRGVRERRYAAEAARTALDRLALLPAERVAIAPFLTRAFTLRDRCSMGDALYVALAGADARLVTLDRRLARAAEHVVPVTLVSET